MTPNPPVIGKPLIGVTVGAAPTAPATRPPGVIEQGKVNTDALLAELAQRIQRMEGAVEQMVPGDRIPSLLRLTKGAAFLSADQIAILGQVTLGDYVRDLNGNPTTQIDPRITQITGNKLRTGVVSNFAGDAWMNLDAGRPGFDNTFLRVRNGIRMDADGYLQLGSNPGKQMVYDPWTGSFSIGDQVLAAGQTMGSIAANANWGASRPVGDLTAQVLANSGTTIVSQAGTLFDFTNGLFRLQVGAGGMVGSYAGQPKLALSSLGNAVFAGDISGSTGNFAGNVSTNGFIKAAGQTATGVVVNGGLCDAVGYFNSTASGSSAGTASVLGKSSGFGGMGVVGVSDFVGVMGQGAVGLQANGALVVSGSSQLGGGLTVNGVASFYGGISVNGNASLSSINGLSTPNNILAYVGIGTPGNTTTPAGFMQVRTISGAVANVPYYL